MTAIGLRYSLLSVVAAGVVASLPIVGVIAIRSDGDAIAVPAADAPAIVEAFTPQARIEPAVEGGHVTGFRLSHVACDSFYAELGLRDGDVVTAIDGLTLASPEDALVVYEQLKGERTVAVDILRNGQHGTLHHTLD